MVHDDPHALRQRMVTFGQLSHAGGAWRMPGDRATDMRKEVLR
jgi:hypothetical protein